MSDNHVLYEKDICPSSLSWGASPTEWGCSPVSLPRRYSPPVVFGLMSPASAILSGFLAITSAVGVV